MKNKNEIIKWKKIVNISNAILLSGIILFLLIGIFQVYSGCVGCEENRFNLNFITPYAFILLIVGLITVIFSSIKYKIIKNEK